MSEEHGAFLVGFLDREAKLLVEDDGGDVVRVDVQVDHLYKQPSHNCSGSLRRDYNATSFIFLSFLLSCTNSSRLPTL